MRKRTKTTEPITGGGVMMLAGESRRVDWSISCGVLPGGAVRNVKGSIDASPETAREAFRKGDVTLRTDEGQTLRLNVVAHTEGSGTAFFEANR